MIAPQGARRAAALIEQVNAAPATVVPDVARSALLMMAEQLKILAVRIHALERPLRARHRQQAASQRLAPIPGVGIITATALAASVTDPALFRSGRAFAACRGRVPRQNSSGGKERLGRLSKMGNGCLRKLLVVGATSVVRRARTSASTAGIWVRSPLAKKPPRVVTVAMANKTARIVWAVLARGDVSRPA